MNLQTIDTNSITVENGTSFEKYFNDSDLFELFEYDFINSDTRCETLEMLLDRDGFPIVSTPTNDLHLEFLRKMKIVRGLSLNSNLYSKKEEENNSQDYENFDQADLKEYLKDSPSTQDGKNTVPKQT